MMLEEDFDNVALNLRQLFSRLHIEDLELLRAFLNYERMEMSLTSELEKNYTQVLKMMKKINKGGMRGLSRGMLPF